VRLDTEEVTTPTTLVARLVETQAAQRPDELAVSDTNGVFSYGQLNSHANRLAHALREMGVRRETAVAVHMDRSRELLAALLAVFKAGATAHLLDPRWPARRTEALLSAMPPRCLLQHSTTATPGTGSGIDVVHVDRLLNRRDPQTLPDPEIAVHPDNLAYVVHTSGSTGRPKAVGVTHRSVSHCVATHVNGHRIVSADRGSWLASPGSSAGVGELWPYLASGASVHAGDAGIVASPAELRDWLVAQAITKAFLSTPVAQELAALPWPGDTTLRLVTVGGDRALRWAPATLPFEVAVSYGSAEANAVTSCLVPWARRCTSHTAAEAERATPPPVGRPWPEVQALILDERLGRRPDGAVDELFVAGPGLTRGYLGRPALTAERLLPNPHGAGPGERMYRTGDLASLGEDGMVFHSGRTDRMVKVRGHRVELGDVEAALLRHPGLTAAAVVSGQDDKGDTRLAAYVVRAAEQGEDATPRAIRSFLLVQLPEYLVPGVIVPVDRLPRNANGKVDRQALPAPIWRDQDPQRPPDTVDDPVAEQVLRLWTSLLGVQDAEPDDHFLECGGTSVTAGRLIAGLREELGVPLRMADFMRKPTFAALLDRVRARVRPSPGRTRIRSLE
jgi:amino acid adenylation domain-containing protein